MAIVKAMQSISQNPHPGFDDDDEKEDKGQGPASPAVEKHLFEARTILVTGQITEKLARETCARLYALAHAGVDPITVIISSPGGHVESGDMIHDTIKFIPPRVRILGTGWVASAGALIYISAERDDRYALPNTRFLLHQPSGGAGGSASDIAIQAREFRRMRDRLNQMFADATGQPIEKIAKDTDRDHWLNAAEAVDYGLVTHIISSADELE